MATRLGVMEVLHPGVVKVSWIGAAGSGTDTCQPVDLSAYPDKTIQAVGDSTDVAITGSNDGTNYVDLTDPSGTAIALDSSNKELAVIRENPALVQPVITGGSSTSVYIIAAGGR